MSEPMSNGPSQAMLDELAIPCEWIDCWSCGGKGFHEDLHEIDPGWYSPFDTEMCDICAGRGGWAVECA